MPDSPPVRPLQVAITSPFVWPWVRRGSERMLHDLSRFLLARGHRVSVYASGPEDSTTDRDGIAYHVLRQRLAFPIRQLNGCHHFAFRLREALRDARPDVVFSMNYFDAFAALSARRRDRAGYKVVFHSAGILSRRYFRAVPLDAWFFRRILREADLVIAVSSYAREVFLREFGRDPVVVPPPVATAQFKARAEPSPGPVPRPRLLFVGDVEVRRKGARALCRALPLVRRRFPDVELVMAGRAGDVTRRELLSEAAQGGEAPPVTFHGVGSVDDLPALYASASVTVLPAIQEAFGMVLVESLACGTPVVGARHGGIPDIVQGPLVGMLFDPGQDRTEVDNIEGLAAAIVGVLEREKTPEVQAACRARSERFSWDTLGERYERLLLDVTGLDRRDG